MQEMRALSDSFGGNKFPGARVLIGEPSAQHGELASSTAPPRSPNSNANDTQVGFINKLDVTLFGRS